MRADIRKMEAAAQVEGENSLRYIQCDLDESKGRPVAVLFWPSSSDSRRVHYPLDPSELSPAGSDGVAYIYTGAPLHIPRALAEIQRSADPLSDEGFRLGFLFSPDVAVMFLTRFSLPITVGSFFGAMNVWGWHWIGALVFAAPGLEC
jgi:hypothetical protein